MSLTFKAVFDRHSSDLKIDQALVRRLHNYALGFVNRNEDHVNFFGGNLLGVYPVRYRTTDRETWFDSVVKMDEREVQNDLHEVEAFDADYQVSSDTFNQSCIYLLHRIYTSTLSSSQKEQALMDTTLIMQYKLISSLMAHYFPYPADQQIAIATYAELSMKFSLKIHGSWGALLQARAKDVLDQHSIHYKTYTEYKNDPGVIYMINDIQGRLREIIKSMVAVFYQVKESGKKFALVSATLERDGLTIVKDKHNQYQTYTRYVKQILSDKPSWVRAELSSIVCDAMHRMPPRLFEDTLAWMSDHQGHAPVIEQLIDEVLNHAYDYVTHNRSFQNGRIPLELLLTRLRALYMASRMVDPALLKSKELAESLVAQAVKTKNPSIQASIRTGVQLYICLRAFSMSYYA